MTLNNLKYVLVLPFLVLMVCSCQWIAPKETPIEKKMPVSYAPEPITPVVVSEESPQTEVLQPQSQPSVEEVKIVQESPVDAEATLGLRVAEVYPEFATSIFAEALLTNLEPGEILKGGDSFLITTEKIEEKLNEMPEESRANSTSFQLYILERIATDELIKRHALGDRPEPETEEQLHEIMSAYFYKTVGHIKAPEDQVAGFYNANKNMFNAPFEEVIEDIENFLSQEERETAFEQHIRNLGKEMGLRLHAFWAADQATKMRNNIITQALKEGKPVLVDFYADWCGPCLYMKPMINKIQQTYAEQLTVVYINVDHHPFLANHHRVMEIPLLLLFDAKGVLASRIEGVTEEAELKKEIKKVLG